MGNMIMIILIKLEIRNYFDQNIKFAINNHYILLI